MTDAVLDAPAPAAAAALRGREKAAILLVSLGREQAAEVLKHLTQDEIEALTLEMAKTQNISSSTTAAVLDEAVHTARAQQYAAEGGVDFAREVLERSLGAEKAAEIIGRLSAVIERRPFEFLRRIPSEQIHAFLRNEAPQTVALVVANLHTTLAASVLSLYDEAEQADIAARIATLNETSPDVVRAVEEVMKQKLSDVVSQEFSAAGGVQSLADILNHVDRSTERNVLEALAELDGGLAEELRSLLFTFEDILKLDDRTIQLVLKETDQKDLALALRGVDDALRERVFSNMSERGAEMLREEIQFMPPQRRRMVEEAQGRIVAVVRRLEEAGGVVLSRAGGDDDMVV
jgi:flagellar motor switch protein FliG